MKRGLLTWQILLVSLIILSGGYSLSAQNESNPFELQHRLPKNHQKQDSLTETSENPFDIESSSTPNTTIEAEEVVNQEAENPFDIHRVKSQTGVEEAVENKPDIPHSEKKIEKPSDTRSGFLFWTILVMMILLALLVTLYRSLIVKIYRAFTNENILKLLQREQSGIISVPYLFLYILFIISAGIFTFQVAFYYETLPFEFKYLAYCTLVVAGFFLLKHSLLKILGFIFPISKEVAQYNFTIIIFSIILGIVLIPFNIFIAFAQDFLTKPGIFTAFAAILAIYLFRALRGIFIGSKFLALHKFHFFMYLCAVEIAPFLILVKILLNGANVH